MKTDNREGFPQSVYFTEALVVMRMLSLLSLLVLSFSFGAALKICSFNIQSFGESKMSKAEVVDVIIQVPYPHFHSSVHLCVFLLFVFVIAGCTVGGFDILCTFFCRALLTS